MSEQSAENDYTPARSNGGVVDLLAALQRSVDAAKARDHKTPQPHGLGSTKGEEDGKQGGVHPDRTREVAEGPDGRGLHGGSGVLDRAGSHPEGRVADRSGRGLTDASPAGNEPAGDATPAACTTCDGTGLIDWMIESDPNCYQEPDDDGKLPCPDCDVVVPPGEGKS